VLFEDRRPQAGFHRGRFRSLVLFQDRIASGDALVADKDAVGALGWIGDQCVNLILGSAAERTSGNFLIYAPLAEHAPSMARAYWKSRSATFKSVPLAVLRLCGSVEDRKMLPSKPKGSIPYGEQLATMIPPVAVRLRRDLAHYLPSSKHTPSCTKSAGSATLKAASLPLLTTTPPSESW
jgi:hypothetical protein